MDVGAGMEPAGGIQAPPGAQPQLLTALGTESLPQNITFTFLSLLFSQNPLLWALYLRRSHTGKGQEEGSGRPRCAN